MCYAPYNPQHPYTLQVTVNFPLIRSCGLILWPVRTSSPGTLIRSKTLSVRGPRCFVVSTAVLVVEHEGALRPEILPEVGLQPVRLVA